MRNLKAIKNSIAFKWVVSYLAIISIMLISIIIISLLHTNTTKKISDDFNKYIYENVTTDVENALHSINHIYMNISTNAHIASVLSAADIYSSEATYSLINDLKAYREFSKNIDCLFLYLKKSDLIISTNGITDSKLFFDTHFNSKKISYEDWLETLVSANESLQYSATPYKDEGGLDTDTVSVLFNLSNTRNDCVGMILSNQSHFVSGLEKINFENLCDIYIYNRSGNLVAYNSRLESNSLPKTFGQISKLNNKANIIYTSDIVVNGHPWKVITVSSATPASQKILLSWIIILTIIFILSIVLYFVVKRNIANNYRPIKKMLSVFDITETTNEYENLFASINAVLDKNSTLAEKISSHAQSMRKINLGKLLRGEHSYSPDELSDFDFRGAYFGVLLFHLENIDSLFEDVKDISYQEKFLDLSFIINNVISELMMEKNLLVHTTEMDSQIACLLNFDENIDSDTIMKISESGCDFINSHFNIELSFSFSKISSNIIDVPVAYNEAVSVLKYQRLLGIKEPMQYIDNYTHSTDAQIIFDLHKEQTLVNAIKTGNKETALTVLNQVFSELEKNHDLPFDYLTYVVLDIASTVIKSTSETEFNESLNFYREIKNCTNLVDLRNHMTQFIDKTCETTLKNSKEHKGRVKFLVSHIEKYVTDNYTDSNLNINSVANYFNMNPDYISLSFKKEKGIPLLAFINNLRIEYAVKLINEGRYTKKEISKMVGFTSERSFYRILKQYEDSITKE